jgi:hypothetical protein
MVHHYMEEQKEIEPETVAFNAVVDSPYKPATVDLTKDNEAPNYRRPDVMMEPTVKTESCCQTPPVQSFAVPRTSDLLDALPIIMVSLGIAYVLGIGSGAMIFSSPDN